MLCLLCGAGVAQAMWLHPLTHAHDPPQSCIEPRAGWFRNGVDWKDKWPDTCSTLKVHAHRQRRCSLWRPGNPTLGQVAGAWRLQNNYVWTAYANEREKIRRSLVGMDVEVMCRRGVVPCHHHSHRAPERHPVTYRPVAWSASSAQRLQPFLGALRG